MNKIEAGQVAQAQRISVSEFKNVCTLLGISTRRFRQVLAAANNGKTPLGMTQREIGVVIHARKVGLQKAVDEAMADIDRCDNASVFLLGEVGNE